MGQFEYPTLTAEQEQAVNTAVETLKRGYDADAANVLWNNWVGTLTTLLHQSKRIGISEVASDVVQSIFENFNRRILHGLPQDIHTPQALWDWLVSWAMKGGRSTIHDRLSRVRGPRLQISLEEAANNEASEATSSPTDTENDVTASVESTTGNPIERGHVVIEFDANLDRFLANAAHEMGHLLSSGAPGTSGHPVIPGPTLSFSKPSPPKPLASAPLPVAQATAILQRTRKLPAPQGERQQSLPNEQFDAVDCATFAPPGVGVGETLMVQVVAYVPAHATKATLLALEFDPDAQRRGFTSLELEVPRGARLSVQLTMPGLKVDARLRSVLWQGQPTSVAFRVTVPRNHKGGTVVGTATVSLDQVPLGRISFKLKVTPTSGVPTLPLSPTGTAQPFETFFISYASQDRDEVLKRVQMLSRLRKRFFQDVLHLDPGDRWEKKLYLRIDECDAVLLFWSSHAKKSKWVMKECHYTIKTKGIEHLLPVIIEGPPPVLPPRSLAKLHMNDWLLYVIKAGNMSQ